MPRTLFEQLHHEDRTATRDKRSLSATAWRLSSQTYMRRATETQLRTAALLINHPNELGMLAQPFPHQHPKTPYHELRSKRQQAMKIILLNGPPSSGKDTALRAISTFNKEGNAPLGNNTWPICLRMSAPIKEAYAAMMHLPLDAYGDIAGMTQTRKEQIQPTLGCSPRQWQIDFSERFMKPLYGDNVFARIWLHRAAQLHRDTVIVVPDCGFKIELETINEYTGPQFTRDDIFLIRLYRKGCGPDYRGKFKGDSREYVYGRGIREVDILNEDKDIFEATIIKQVTSFLTGRQ